MALTLVPTPIGNLGDMTPRAIDVLREADLVLCEDTRHSGPVLAKWGVTAQKRSYQKFNERARVDEILALLKEGKKIALISDAGTPGVSDPGSILVEAAVEAGFEVDCLPGATAFVPALVLSTFPTHPALFLGFVPDSSGDRQKWIAPWADQYATLIAYLSPHKAQKHLAHLAALLGPRRACVARELSKVHQEVVRGTLESLAAVPDWRGELCLVIAPPLPDACVTPDWRPLALELRAQGRSVKDVVRQMEEAYGVRANDVKKLLMKGAEDEK